MNLILLDCFADFPVLTRIDLDHNKFSTIKDYQFGGLGDTGVVITLRSNLISTIEPNAFKDLYEGFIDLNNNKIELLYSSWLQPILDRGNQVNLASKFKAID